MLKMLLMSRTYVSLNLYFFYFPNILWPLLMYGHVGLDEIIWLLITCTFYFIVFFALGKTE